MVIRIRVKAEQGLKGQAAAGPRTNKNFKKPTSCLSQAQRLMPKESMQDFGSQFTRCDRPTERHTLVHPKARDDTLNPARYMSHLSLGCCRRPRAWQEHPCPAPPPICGKGLAFRSCHCGTCCNDSHPCSAALRACAAILSDGWHWDRRRNSLVTGSESRGSLIARLFELSMTH